MTDEHKGYNGIGERFSHHTVNHSIGEYVKHYFIHTNGLENTWSLFKRKSTASTTSSVASTLTATLPNSRSATIGARWERAHVWMRCSAKLRAD